ncbi:MAG TPA: hypothetical protein VFE31_13825 [Opitutaceae bacterium]|jgi:hypothetical protein|nr:hypothetical protein [Opitutaceae bacterium]
MKSYTLPAGILLAVTGLLGLGITTSLKHAGQASAQANADHSDQIAASADLDRARANANRMEKQAKPADDFLALWQVNLSNDTTIDDIFDRLDKLAIANVLSPSGKNFTNSSQYFFDGKQLPVLSVDITVAGDYARTLSWLGAVESSFPLARVQQISYTGTGSSIALAAHLIFPRKFNSK